MTSPLYHADTTNIGLDEQHEHDSRITSSDGGGSDHEAFQSGNLWDPSSWPDFQLDLPLDHPLPWQQIPEYDNDFLNDFGPLDASAPLSVAFDQPFKQHDHQSLRPQSGDYNEQPHVDSIDASDYHPSGCASNHQCCTHIDDQSGTFGESSRAQASQSFAPQIVQQHSQQTLDVLAWQSQVIPPCSDHGSPQPQGQTQTPTPEANNLEPFPTFPCSEAASNTAITPSRRQRCYHHHHHSSNTPPSQQQKCPSCPTICRRPSDLRRHIDEVHRKVRYHCTFQGCTVSYPRQTKLRSHWRAKHARFQRGIEVVMEGE